MPSARGELPDRLRLALAVGERAAGAAGVDAVDDLRARADAAVEAEDVGEQLGHLLRRRGDDVDAAAGVLVVVGDGEHLRIQARQDAARGRAGARRCRSRTRRPAIIAPTRSRTLSVAASVEPREAEAQVHPRVAREPAPADQPDAPRRAGPVEPRRARHERAVEVEEGRPRRGGLPAPASFTSERDARRPRRRQAPWTRTMTASPWPPPLQIAAQPMPPPRRRSSWTSAPRSARRTRRSGGRARPRRR